MPDAIKITDPSADNQAFPKIIKGTHYPIFTFAMPLAKHNPAADEMVAFDPPPPPTPDPVPDPVPVPVPVHTLKVKIIPVNGNPGGKEYTPTVTTAATTKTAGAWELFAPVSDLTKGTDYEIIATITVGATSRSDPKEQIHYS